jgi:hypothetical protein
MTEITLPAASPARSLNKADLIDAAKLVAIPTLSFAVAQIAAIVPTFNFGTYQPFVALALTAAVHVFQKWAAGETASAPVIPS